MPEAGCRKHLGNLQQHKKKKKKKDAEQESKLEFETKNGKNALLGFGDVNFKMGPVGGMDL